MRKIAANYIFPVSSAPLKNGIIVLDEKNLIVDIIDTKGELKEIQNLEFYSGLIVPGFIDVFTLLRFSDFSKYDFDTCLHSNFGSALKENLLKQVSTPETIQRGINQLEAYGTVATVDIYSNHAHIKQKQNSKLYFSDIDLSQSSSSLQLPELDAKFEADKSILLNCLILENKKDFQPSAEEMNQYCIGTGSLSTHLKLSVFDELKALQELLPEITFWELIKWGTINGAKHLQIEQAFGSIDIGKKPGLNLLTKLDYTNLKLRANSELKVLV